MSAAAAGRKKLLTLGEVARRAGVSMATALRYKKLYQDRISSEGEGRKQRYRVAAVKEFKGFKNERSTKRRGAGRKKKAASQAAGTQAKGVASGPSLLTLSSICQQTGISYPTLQRYVRLFGDRIPHEGEGRKRRYHPDAVAVFRELRAESKPGRKPKAAPAAKSPARKKRKTRVAAKPAAAAPKLLTLTAIGQQTGISGPTLQRYLKLYGDRIPHEGEGRKRRYHPEAVAVFRELRSRSRRGRKPKAKTAPAAKTPVRRKRKARAARVRRQPAAGSVEARLAALEAQVSLVLQKLDQPITITLNR
ncbi:MAG: hypothetical protein F4X04_01350 [Holophagales bacterium]|nr:hypothetical protein [Holophagales bacterium]